MNVGDFVELIGKTIFERPFGGGSTQAADAAELAEIRHAVLEEIERKCARSGGATLFPYNRVTLKVRGANPEQASALKGEFLRAYFEREIGAALVKAEAEHPGGLRVAIETDDAPAIKGQPWLTVATSFDQPAAPVAEAAASRVARLVVLEGDALERELPLTRHHTNIGRSVDVFRTDGQARRNHLAFSEEGEVNLTVSREHAHIKYDPAAEEFRLFNDRFYDRDRTREACGVWLIRDGATQEVHRNTRGTKLRDGDEIRLGKALVRFEG